MSAEQAPGNPLGLPPDMWQQLNADKGDPGGMCDRCAGVENGVLSTGYQPRLCVKHRREDEAWDEHCRWARERINHLSTAPDYWDRRDQIEDLVGDLAWRRYADVSY